MESRKDINELITWPSKLNKYIHNMKHNGWSQKRFNILVVQRAHMHACVVVLKEFCHFHHQLTTNWIHSKYTSNNVRHAYQSDSLSPIMGRNIVHFWLFWRAVSLAGLIVSCSRYCSSLIPILSAALFVSFAVKRICGKETTRLPSCRDFTNKFSLFLCPNVTWKTTSRDSRHALRSNKHDGATKTT